MVIYTSGTTGRPKGAVHVHGGFPIKAAQDLAHTFDLRAGDALFWFTDLGWMMGPWAISGVAAARRPARPLRGRARLPGPRPDLVDRRAPPRDPPRPVADGRPGADRPRHRARSAPTTSRSLRVLGSTGEPWNPERGGGSSARSAAAGCRSSTTSGGTEVSGGIVGCNLLEPDQADVVRRAVLGHRGGRRRPDGEPRPRRGRRARDPGAAAGHDARLLARPGALPRDLLAPLARDLGPRRLGARSTTTATGTSTAAPTTRSRSPASASGRPRSRPPRRPTRRWSRPRRSASRTRSRARRSSSSCVLRRGETDDADLRAAISRRVVEELGKALKPEAVVVVPALPRTRCGKIMRRVARAAYLGLDPGDLSALENPATIEAIRQIGPRSGGRRDGHTTGDGGRMRPMSDRDRQGHRQLGRPGRHGRPTSPTSCVRPTTT